MKIIGKTNGGFIIEASQTEMKALLANSDTRRADIEKTLVVGVELSFTTALHNLALVKDISIDGSYQTLGRLNDAYSELGKVIKIVEGVKEPLLTIQSKIKEAQI